MQRLLNCITINTDASFSFEKQSGGYAFYIVCDLFKIQKGGKFKVVPKNSIDAEMMCMANAIYTLLAQKELPQTKLIVINSDCLTSFPKIKMKSDTESGRKVALLLRALRKRMMYNGSTLPKFEFRHVKGHTQNKDARSYVNRWCDEEAKKWMRLAEKETK